MDQSTQELNSEIEDTRRELASDLDALHERVSPAAMVERRRAATRSRLAGIRNRVMGHSSTASGRGVGSSVTSTARDAMDAAEERYDGSPLAMGVVAFGAGMVAAALMPATDAESRAADKIVSAARDQGLVDKATAMGHEVGQHLKQSAAESVSEVTSTMQGSAQHVQQEVSSPTDGGTSQWRAT